MEDITFTCPATDRGPQKDAFILGSPDIVGCGKEFDVSADFFDTGDFDGYLDCPHCGMFFEPMQGL